jgi:hypothetical protein
MRCGTPWKWWKACTCPWKKASCFWVGIYLRVGAGIELQWDVHLWPFLLPSLVGNVAPYGRFTADVALVLDELVDSAGSVPLLARQPLILYQEFFDPGFVGPQHRLWTWYREPVSYRPCRRDSLAHGWTGTPELTRDLPNALLFQEVGPSDGFPFFHADHLPLRYH